MRMTFDVVCHGKNSIAKYSYGGIYCHYDVTWNSLCGSHDDCDCDLDLLCLYLSRQWCVEADLVGCLLLESCL